MSFKSISVEESFINASLEWSASISLLLAIAQVTAQAGYKSSSDVTLDVTFAETIGSGTTFPPPKSLPSNKETPETGRVGQTATVAGPVIKPDFKQILWRGTLLTPRKLHTLYQNCPSSKGLLSQRPYTSIFQNLTG